MKNSLRHQLVATLVTSAILSFAAHAADTPAKPAAIDGRACSITPAPRTVEYPWMSIARWQAMFQEDLEVAESRKVDLLFVGDSITEGWNKKVWDKSFGKWKTANFGIGGDHTGNVLWRLDHGQADKLSPKLVVLTIGVNNFFHCQANPEQVFEGVKAVVTKLRTIYPNARILLNAVLPYAQSASDPKRAEVIELNRMIATLDDGKSVIFKDYGKKFLQPNGDMSPTIMADYLHPTAKGYQVWSDAMLPDIKRLMK
ncbi:mucin-desulfating sulfatase [Duganella sp. Leaf126]|uniref:GDSL-type esterase/lipase family protein n=1 Tax=Duganella sp. Leaf126 TaxID=1736266 RepID=UPI0006F61759|nr:GDSL-type esterase/lipase family protein [Duganella sp. Leaf126]KQQ32038.1 mucin-desulfating sulfatase [Duganella sp. Leaf126]